MDHQIRRNFGVIDYKFKKMKKFRIKEKIMPSHQEGEKYLTHTNHARERKIVRFRVDFEKTREGLCRKF